MAYIPVATETFDGTGALSGDWTTRLNTLSRSNDHGNGGTANDTNQADWTGDSFDNDQYAQCLCYSLTSWDQYANPGARGSAGTGSTWNGYTVTTDGATGTGYHCGILEYDDSDEAAWLTDISQDFNNGDKQRITVVGTTIKMWRDTGSGFSEVNSTSDATHGAGQASGGTWGDGEIIDDWEGGNIGEEAAGAPYYYAQLIGQG